VTASLLLSTAGAYVAVRDLTGRHVGPLARAAGVEAGRPADEDAPLVPDVALVVEKGRHPFPSTGMTPVTRGVWTSEGSVVLDSVGGSGFAQTWYPSAGRLQVRTRWSPGPLEQGAAGLRSRFDALRAQVLLHYPALWWAASRGWAPLHVSVLELDGVVVMLAGPGGVGKSTLVAQALASGARATCDNVAVSDGETAAGLREPLRLAVADGGPSSGARTTHGRRELRWDGQVPALRPDLVVVVRRGGAGPRVHETDPELAARALVAGTYAAGELRRFWTLSAVVGLATGTGPVHPDVAGVARRLTGRLPCLELELGTSPGASLHTLLGPHLDRARRQESTR